MEASFSPKSSCTNSGLKPRWSETSFSAPFFLLLGVKKSAKRERHKNKQALLQPTHEAYEITLALVLNMTCASGVCAHALHASTIGHEHASIENADGVEDAGPSRNVQLLLADMEQPMSIWCTHIHPQSPSPAQACRTNVAAKNDVRFRLWFWKHKMGVAMVALPCGRASNYQDYKQRQNSAKALRM